MNVGKKTPPIRCGGDRTKTNPPAKKKRLSFHTSDGPCFAPFAGMAIIPTHFFLTKGVGVHEKDLRAFEEALRDAGINTCNLIKTSSIIARGCKRITREEGMKAIEPGQITFAVIAQSQTNEPGQHLLETARLLMAITPNGI